MDINLHFTSYPSQPQPKTQPCPHFTSSTDRRRPTYYCFKPDLLFFKKAVAAFCHQERGSHIPMQFSSGTSVLIRMSSMAISPDRPFPITPSNTI